jgi:hypothetical protein
MPTDPLSPPLSPEQLAAVLKQLDEVEAEALQLRDQITKAMRVRRASDRSVASDSSGNNSPKKR